MMSRPKITITNVDKQGRVTDSGWHVRVGNKWTTFTEQAWAKGGIAWLNSQLKLR